MHESQQALSKNLIVCLDGTWCDGDHGTEPQTNIQILASIIDPKPGRGRPPQRVHYDSGVGTGGFVSRLLGGAFGKGVGGSVLAAYRFLSQFYEPGDKIYVFGFSRGAFNARSLCGFLSASGLLTEDMCNASNLEFAWNYYRTAPKARYPADRARLRRITYPESRVQFLGVFDTVGSLGIPKSAMNRVGRHALQFHDTDVSSVVDHACQALAIDEHRAEFEPAVWTEPRHHDYKTVEQVWFPGSHANIGGGCSDTNLSDVVLVWMLSRAQQLCPALSLRLIDTWNDDLKQRFSSNQHNHMGKIHDPQRRMFWLRRWRPQIRLIDRCEPKHHRFSCRSKIYRRSKPIGEMLHWSALTRWDDTRAERRKLRYEPPNLVAALESVGSKIPVVAADGELAWLGSLNAQTQTIDHARWHLPPMINGGDHTDLLERVEGHIR